MVEEAAVAAAHTQEVLFQSRLGNHFPIMLVQAAAIFLQVGILGLSIIPLLWPRADQVFQITIQTEHLEVKLPQDSET
jgi:hypothetical protein